MTPVWPDTYPEQRDFALTFRKRLEVLERKVLVGTLIQSSQPSEAQLNAGWVNSVNGGQAAQVPEGGKVQWFDPARNTIRTSYTRMGDWGGGIDGRLMDTVSRPTYSFSQVFYTDTLEVAADQFNVTIPQTHKDFLVFFRLRTTEVVSTAAISLRVNLNNGAVYSTSILVNTNVAVIGVESILATQVAFVVPGGSSYRHQYAVGFLWFPRYSIAARRPTFWGQYSVFRDIPVAADDKTLRHIFGSINTAAPITSLELLSGAGGDFDKGSQLTVIGVL